MCLRCNIDILHAVSTSELEAEGVLFLEEEAKEVDGMQYWDLETALTPAVSEESPISVMPERIGDIEMLDNLAKAGPSNLHSKPPSPSPPPPYPNNSNDSNNTAQPPLSAGSPQLSARSPISPPNIDDDDEPTHDVDALALYKFPPDEDDDVSMYDAGPLDTYGIKRSAPDEDDYDRDNKRLRAFALLHKAIASVFLTAKFTPPLNDANSSNDLCLHISNVPKEPEHVGQVRKSQFRSQWEEAMASEFSTAMKMGTFRWEKTTPDGKNDAKALPLKWVYKYKTDSNGFIQRFKAHLCARGDLQATTHDTYASTLALKVFRLMCAIVAHFDLEMEQMDAVNAYLNAELPRPIHLQSPPGIETPEGSRLLLLRALYGLKESGFLWQQKLRHTLEDLGLKQVPGVECLYTDGFLTFFFYIDDMALIYARRHLDRAEHFKTELRKAFEIKFLGNLTWYLGIKVTRDRSTRSLWLSQEAYINKIVSTFEVHLTARKTRSPLPSNLTLPPPSASPSPAITRAYQRRTGSVTILAKGKTIYQLVLRITQWGEKGKSRETRRSQNP